MIEMCRPEDPTLYVYIHTIYSDVRFLFNYKKS